MNINVPGPGFGLFSSISIFTLLLTIVKEVLMIILLFKGIQVANEYLNKNKANGIKVIFN